MRTDITKEDVNLAISGSLWDLGNKVLYDLCREHPKHDQPDAIIAKVWLIGRTYTAAIERRKNAQGISDDFYEKNVVEEMKGSQIDDWLAALPSQLSDTSELAPVIEVHWRLMQVFHKITGLYKRSLASKYLHFHCPDLFFIYDSRASNAIAQIKPLLKQLVGERKSVVTQVADRKYLAFCHFALALREKIRRDFGINLTPRDIDKVLLWIAWHDRVTKASGPQVQGG